MVIDKYPKRSGFDPSEPLREGLVGPLAVGPLAVGPLARWATDARSQGMRGIVASAAYIAGWQNACITSSRSATHRAIGPGAERTSRWPDRLPRRGTVIPLYERRSTVGLNAHSPVMNAGMRTEPPTSVPRPRGEPRAAMSAHSPPVEPPGLRPRSYGLHVVP